MEAVDALGDYLMRIGFVGDFPEVDARAAERVPGGLPGHPRQGGTNTKLRRLRPFFTWMEDAYGITSPYRTGKVAYYAPSEPPPAALGEDVVGHLLAACNGKAYEDVRDTAILRLLATGVRRGSHGLFVEDVDFTAGEIHVARKDARRRAAVMRVVDGEEHRAGRLVPLNDEALLALHRWLRVRAAHKAGEGPRGRAAVVRHPRAGQAHRQRDPADGQAPGRGGRVRPGHHQRPRVPAHPRPRPPRRGARGGRRDGGHGVAGPGHGRPVRAEPQRPAGPGRGPPGGTAPSPGHRPRASGTPPGTARRGAARRPPPRPRAPVCAVTARSSGATPYNNTSMSPNVCPDASARRTRLNRVIPPRMSPRAHREILV